SIIFRRPVWNPAPTQRSVRWGEARTARAAPRRIGSDRSHLAAGERMKTWFLLATSVTLLGCTGVVESGGPDDGASGGAGPTAPVDGPTVGGTPPEQILDSPACQTPSPGDAPLRRLSNAEYRNTVVDLLGHEDLVETLAASFVSETESLGFRNNAAFLSV